MKRITIRIWSVCILFLCMMMVTGCQNDQNTVRFSLTEQQHEALSAYRLPMEIVHSEDSAMLPDTKSICAETLTAPVCVIGYAYRPGNDGKFHIFSPDMKEFTIDPSAAQTLLYAVCKDDTGSNAHFEYQLYALNPADGSVLVCTDDEGRHLEYSVLTNRQPKEIDISFCNWLLKTLPISDAAEGSVKAEVEKISALQQMLIPANVESICRQAYTALSITDFSSILPETDGSTLLSFEEWSACAPVLVIDRKNCPENQKVFTGSHPSNYPYPDYEQWIQNASLFYCAPENVDISRHAIPRAVLVCENTYYHYMGDYQQIGALYSYITRYTLYDLQTSRILAWTVGYADAQAKGYSLNGSFHQTGQQVVKKEYPTDTNGYQIYDHVYGYDWKSVLGLMDAHISVVELTGKV